MKEKSLEASFSRASGFVGACSVDQAALDHLCSVGLVLVRDKEDSLALARTHHLGCTCLDKRGIS